ncbi:MAG: gamma-glutamyltransferase [Arenicella sp.]|nr:gamma-glutamyltransferase [Arenicella sp.]
MLTFCPKQLLVILFSFGAVSGVYAADATSVPQKKPSSIIRYDTIHHPVKSNSGMVVSQRIIASEVGASVLAQGGNAVDAAVAVSYALAVLLPRAGNIGGGGFMLVYLKDQDKTIAIDYRETAPKLAHKDLYLLADGSVDRKSYRSGLRSVAVPGTVAGMDYALSKYGTMSLKAVMQPAIDLAKNGFVMDYDTASAIATRETMLKKDAAARATFFHKDGSLYKASELFVQDDLAQTLGAIAEHGADAFYKGAVADQIVAKMVKGGGLISHADLANYTVAERNPIVGSYRGQKIVSMPPPSSGGVHVVQMLNILENFNLQKMGAGSAESLHLVAESMRYAYADRSKHLGDPDFYKVPVDWLTSKDYAKQIANKIDLKRATPSSEVLPGKKSKYESVDTTHFSVVDKSGNAVSNTYTLNFSFGSGAVVDGAGFLLNNEMTDFNAKAGTADAFGLIGGAANSILANKRPLSAMTPTMVFDNGELSIVTGSPGGSRIINAVLQQLINVIDHNMNIADATHAPRIHHQWQPDRLEVEASISPDTKAILRAMGHTIKEAGTMGSLQSILLEGGQLNGASDPRRPGAGAIGAQ